MNYIENIVEDYMKKITKAFLCIAFILGAPLAYTQEEENKNNSEDTEDSWQAPKLKTFSNKQIKAECKKYNKKYISYYSKVYYVKNCRRHEILSQLRIEKISLKYNVLSVDGSTIIMIKKGAPMAEKKKYRNCKKLNNKYIMNQDGNVFWVKDCTRRAFPDWETYLADRKKKRLKNSDIVEVSDNEFNSLKVGKDLPSILDDAYKKLYSKDDDVEEIIPVDEACEGINGKFISYYSKIYKIVKCYKREVNPEKFLVKYKNYKLREVSSTVWLSLPNGKPYSL